VHGFCLRHQVTWHAPFAAVDNPHRSSPTLCPPPVQQASTEVLSFRQAARRVVKEAGLVGLFGRGLGIKVFGNGLQGMTFGVVWRYLDDCVFSANAPMACRR
jgi:hypothetical protein